MNKRKRERTPQGRGLEMIRPDAAGIDLGSQEHWVCGPRRDDDENAEKPNIATFGTTTAELERLADWLEAEGVRCVAMESTYVYWIPLHELLEERGFEVLLANARQLKQVPGRKTDKLDCQWLQRLHSCGLLRGSFRPHESVVRMRSLHRQMQNLVAQRARFVQWMQRELDQMNVQVHRAVSDLTGVTGMRIVRAIVSGERDAEQLAGLRDSRCRHSPAKFAEFLTGNWREEHLFNLSNALELFDAVQKQIQAYEEKLQEELQEQACEELREEDCPEHPNPSKEKAIRRRGNKQMRKALYQYSAVDLTRIDGISAGAACTILTEIGADLSAFPSERHFVSWLGLAPRHSVSGGKVLQGKKSRRGMGATRISNVLRMAATSLIRSKSALGASLRRKARHKGMKVAIFATARKLAKLVYRLLHWGLDYVDIGEAAYEERYRQRTLAAIERTAEHLGYKLVPNTAPTGAAPSVAMASG